MSTARKVTIGAGISAAAIALAVPLTAQFEGLWTTAKIDQIGTGRPLTWCYGETEGPVKLGQRFTKQQCDDMLAAKLPRYAAEISACIHVPISDKEGAAFTSFAYNVGSAGFCKSSAARKLNAGDHVGACNALMAWNKAQGRVVKGLANRRAKERALCLEGAIHDDKSRFAVATPEPAPQPAKRWWQK